ncbi:hypothetical protein RJ640_011503 [Escallonia rubra]|uniref:Glutamate receptor n=1 Tax=Escallonia rubra TaxID=112253 RepID=A0AA88RC25_9ASTE|nr:hypothetical protein RJ640_011503 [Escallonia rubra]
MTKNHVVSLFFCLALLIISKGVATAQSLTVPVNVGVILDKDTWAGKMGLRCISMALNDFYASHGHYKTRLVLNFRDSNRSVVRAALMAQDLLKNVKVQAIIGPVTSMQANFVINLGEHSQVPIISFSATSPSLSSLRSEYFIRATHIDTYQVKAISSLVQAFGWRAVVPVYADTEFGEGVIPFLTDALQEVNARIPYRSVIHPSANDAEIAAELYKLMTMQTRVFVVHMPPDLGSQFFAKANEVGMMSKDYVWIITTGITNHFSMVEPLVNIPMPGVLGVKPHVPRRKRLDHFITRWKWKSRQKNSVDANLSIFGLWAYDATIALAMAVEKVGARHSSYNSTHKHLRDVLASTRLHGLSGDFHIVNGQLRSSAFQIVNIIGNVERVIGFWTEKNGISKGLNFTSRNMYSTSKQNLGTVVWPGETIYAPKGWVIPTNEKKLRVGVPVKDGLISAFVNVTRGSSSSTTVVTGFCIDVFDAVMTALPYNVPYEYVPFVKHNGEMAGDYNELVYQVFLGKFDAVVGDVTILANRSLYVDFTLPYTESGVTMIVPVKDIKEKNAWVFLKPLTWDLWVTSACFFVFIGFFIWILEHKENEDFSGTRAQQIGTSFWFSFSTMVFAHSNPLSLHLNILDKHKLEASFPVTNATLLFFLSFGLCPECRGESGEFVVIIWCFVVLILTQSYTASLTSMLTVRQLEPTFTSVQDLMTKGETIGYPKDSFVLQLLKQFNIDSSKLKEFNVTSDLEVAFSKGSSDGGMAAAFNEIPYLKLFLEKHCSKYALVGPTIKTNGFGFVFPKGSPLVPDVSTAVLSVTEGDKMVQIQKAWFGERTNCPDDASASLASSSLSLNSFWGLFLIVGVASSIALIIFTSTLVFEHRHTLMHFVSEIYGYILAR